MLESASPVEMSVVIPVGRRQADMAELYSEYSAGLDKVGASYEMIFVLDGPQPAAYAALRALRDRGAPVTLLNLSRVFGEATALAAGFEHAAGAIVLTLPAYHQIEGSEIPTLVAALDRADMSVGRRWPRAGGRFEVFRRAAFHRMVGAFVGSRFRDLGCGARAMRRRVVEEISLYGDQHRFLALLAERQGFRVVEVDVRQSPQDRNAGRYPLREYAHRALDILTVLFLLRFTKKPLRFFGMVGVSTFVLGSVLIAYLVVERLFFDQSLAERPALLLASLLAVLGLQLFAIGLLGELIIFTHARGIKDYQVEEVIEFSAEREPAGEASPGIVTRPLGFSEFKG
jgi:glycosyltransferase involved in cell wall biosynthesis